MINSIAKSLVFIPVYSERYSDKADNYTNGVGFEMRAIENMLRTNPDSIRVIPIVRNNPTNRLPVSFKNIKSVDMRALNCRLVDFSLFNAWRRRAPRQLT